MLGGAREEVEANMKLLLDDMDELIASAGYCAERKYENEVLNTIYNYCFVFFTKEAEVITLTGQPLEVVLYSKYYWLTRYVKKYNEVNGYDAGIEQQQFKLIEELEQRLGDVDWDLLQRIDEDMVK